MAIALVGRNWQTIRLFIPCWDALVGRDGIGISCSFRPCSSMRGTFGRISSSGRAGPGALRGDALPHKYLYVNIETCDCRRLSASPKANNRHGCGDGDGGGGGGGGSTMLVLEDTSIVSCAPARSTTPFQRQLGSRWPDVPFSFHFCSPSPIDQLFAHFAKKKPPLQRRHIAIGVLFSS